MGGGIDSADEGNLKRKALDRAKYIVNNSWKVLALGAIVPFSIWVSLVAATGAWTPKQMKQYSEQERIKAEVEAEYKSYTEYRFNRIFKDADAKTFNDSVNIYQKYGLPIKLLEPSLGQKENAIKQNELERSIN